jgi:hypothetical protein
MITFNSETFSLFSGQNHNFTFPTRRFQELNMAYKMCVIIFQSSVITKLHHVTKKIKLAVKSSSKSLYRCLSLHAVLFGFVY